MSDKLLVFRVLFITVAVFGLAMPVCADSMRPLIDPTRPSGWLATAAAPAESAAQPAGALRLQGTFSRAGKRSAMISGQRVGVGDEISGAEVLEINNNKVTLRVDGETVELASLLPAVKSPANKKGDNK